MSHFSDTPPHVAIRGFLSGRGRLAWSTLYSLPSGMLRWVVIYTAGDWDLTNSGFASAPCGVSCAQDSQADLITYLHLILLSYHALFPFEFPRQVG